MQHDQAVTHLKTPTMATSDENAAIVEQLNALRQDAHRLNLIEYMTINCAEHMKEATGIAITNDLLVAIDRQKNPLQTEIDALEDRAKNIRMVRPIGAQTNHGLAPLSVVEGGAA